MLSNGPSQLLVLASEEQSLFSVVVAMGRSRKLDLFLENFRQRLLEIFNDIRIHPADDPELKEFSLSGRKDQRIIGSQNDFLFTAKYFFLNRWNKPALSDRVRELEHVFNRTPMSYLRMESPMKAFYHLTGKFKEPVK